MRGDFLGSDISFDGEEVAVVVLSARGKRTFQVE